MSIKWGENFYASLPADLGLSDGLQLKPELPGDWPNEKQRKKFKTLESTLQTLVAFHLWEVCGEPIELFGMSGSYWGGADIYGFDPFGRVHLFELKRDRVDKPAVRQISNYLLSHVFADREALIRYWRELMKENELRVKRLGRIIAAALADLRWHNIGYEFVRQHGEAGELTEQQWGKLPEEAWDDYLIRALLKSAKRIKTVPSVDELIETASRWRERLLKAMESLERRFFCENPAVIWLVGPRFSPDVEEMIQKWRAQGLDARCIESEAFFSTRENGLILRVRRENFPGREQLTNLLWKEWQEWKEDPNAKPKPLKLFLYNTVRASDKKRENGAGLPSESPYADLDGREIRPSV